MGTAEEVLAEMRDGLSGSARQIADDMGIPVGSARRALRRLERDRLVASDNYQRRARVYLLEDEEG